MDEKALKDEELESVGGGLDLPGVARAAGAARVYNAAFREDTAFQNRLMVREEQGPPAGGAPRAGGEAPPACGGELLSGPKFSLFEGK